MSRKVTVMKEGNQKNGIENSTFFFACVCWGVDVISGIKRMRAFVTNSFGKRAVPLRGLGGVVIGILLLLIGGCGLIEESESTSYHIPNWTSDGEIIALKRWMKHRKTLISNSEPIGFRETVVLMGTNGENERELFRVELGSPKLLELSPQGNYIGLIDGAVLLLYDRDGNVLAQINPDPDVTYIKFSPDETMLYGSEETHNMVFFALPDLSELARNEFGGGGGFVDSVSVVYYDWNALKMALYNTETHSKTLQTVQLVPEIYSLVTNKVHAIDASILYTYELGAENYTEVGISWAPYKYGDFTGQHLSPDGGKVVMGATALFDKAGAGIYVLDVESGGEVVRIR
jgi:hypothetical protein